MRRAIVGGVTAMLLGCDVPGLGTDRADREPRLLYGVDGNLATLAPDGQSRRADLMKVPPGGIARDPAWSADASQVAFAYTPPVIPARGTTIALPETVIRILNVATGEARTIASPERPGGALERPMWSADGRTIFASAITPVFDGAMVTDVEEAVVRLQIPASGTASVERIVAGGMDGAISKDGRSLAWVRRTPDGRVIEVGSADGTGARIVVGADVAIGVAGPRFSPDGKRIAFAAISPFTPFPTVTPVPRRGAFGPAPALAAPVGHGLPMDAFVVGVDGTGLTRLTTLGEDSPSIAWARDGLRIAIVSGGGIYVLTLATNALRTIEPQGGHGAIDWR